MKVRVRIEDRTYVVEIDDPQAAPVVAMVDGHRYELWPEDGLVPSDAAAAPAPAALRASTTRPQDLSPARTPTPLQPGASVTPGQQPVRLEAMNML